MKYFFEKMALILSHKDGLIKSVGILVGGTAISQLISVISLPILTRLYTPAEFSTFAVYFSILSILSVVSCLRFEIAIPIPPKNEDAICLLILALISNLLITIFISIIIILFQDYLLGLFNQHQLAAYIWLIPLGTFFAGLFNAIQYWTTRQKQFSKIAKAKVFQSIGGSSIQICFGLANFGVSGLIIGQIFNYSAGLLTLFKSFFSESKTITEKITVSRVVSNYKKYDKFPKYSSIDALANTAGIQLPIIIIASLSLGSEAGYLMLAMQILGMPMKFIGNAVAQVYLANAPEAYTQGHIRTYTISVLQKLYQFSFSILVIIGIASPFLVGYIFGHQWQQVGSIISWMVPWFIFQMISSPVSMIMHIANKQKLMLILTTFGFVLKVSVLYLQYYVNKAYLLESYAISSALFYCVCYIIFSKFSGLHLRDHWNLLVKTIIPITIAIFISAIIIYISTHVEAFKL